MSENMSVDPTYLPEWAPRIEVHVPGLIGHDMASAMHKIADKMDEYKTAITSLLAQVEGKSVAIVPIDEVK